MKAGDYRYQVYVVVGTREDCEKAMAKLHELFTITEKGMGKRTPFEEYRVTNRGGQGVRNYAITPKTPIAASTAAEIANIAVTVAVNRGRATASATRSSTSCTS